MVSEPIRYRTLPDGSGRARVVMLDGREGFEVRFTDTCSGCYEWQDDHLYPYDEKAQCKVGAGCHECGYTGKRRREHWIPFDMRVAA